MPNFLELRYGEVRRIYLPFLAVCSGVVDGCEQPQSVAPCASLDGAPLGAHYLLLPLLPGRGPFLIAQRERGRCSNPVLHRLLGGFIPSNSQ
jgi:hypothetical protein